MSSGVYVHHLINLFMRLSWQINIYISPTGDTYCFNEDTLPKEIYFMKVHSIDDPSYQSEGTPLTINIELSEFDNYESFNMEFNDYLV